MATWTPLRDLLAGVDDSITLTWDKLNSMVGGMPPSAEKYQAFWAGDRSAWAGFRAENVRVGKSVTFVRKDGSRVGAASKADSDETLRRAAALTGITDKDALIREGLEMLIRTESAKRLAALGGTDRSATAAPRRQGWPK